MAKDKSKKAAEPEEKSKKKAGGGDLVGPGSGGNFVAKDLVGELLLITPTAWRRTSSPPTGRRTRSAPTSSC
jgi:hypothetical protein